MHDQNEKFNRVTEIIKKNQTEIVELQNIINDIKNSIKNINSRIDQVEKRNWKLKERAFENIQSEEKKKKEKKWKKFTGFMEIIRRVNMYITGVSTVRERTQGRKIL